MLEASKRGRGGGVGAGTAVSTERCAAVLLDALPAVMWYVRRQMRSRRAKGLSVPQFRTLVLLRRFPAVTLSTVADHLGASLPTASRIVAGLVGKGLIARKACREDRRQVNLELTARGGNVLDAAMEGTRSMIAGRLAELPTGKLGTVTEAMGLLAAVFSREPGKAADSE